MTQSEQLGAITQVLLPVEGSSAELLVQEHAVGLAAQLGVPLKVVHVAQAGREAPPDAFDYVRRLCWRRHVPFEKAVRYGLDVVGEVAAEANPSDVIVIGTRLLGSSYHVGSVTEGLVHRAPCPVHVVRLQGPRGRPAARNGAGVPVAGVSGGNEGHRLGEALTESRFQSTRVEGG